MQIQRLHSQAEPGVREQPMRRSRYNLFENPFALTGAAHAPAYQPPAVCMNLNLKQFGILCAVGNKWQTARALRLSIWQNNGHEP